MSKDPVEYHVNAPGDPSYVPDEMYRWTLYDAPEASENRFHAVYNHDEKPYWLAIGPRGEGDDHMAIVYTETGEVTKQAKTDAQCLLNILTRENAVLDGCRVVLETGVAGGSSEAYECAGLE